MLAAPVNPNMGPSMRMVTLYADTVLCHGAECILLWLEYIKLSGKVAAFWMISQIFWQN